ncbi:CoA transferase [Leptolyngbya sp. 15MV]|nr:CoA transferase [Leptolyngbya sp. 15MV]
MAGIRVVDLTTVIFGPYATQVLADYGADVIKVETPDGDTTRHTGPAAEPGMASLYLGANRNKRSLVLDLRDERARDALLRLVAGADVFVHNIRPQKLAALGLDRQRLMDANPRLIYVGLHGFGEQGPYSGKPAYDDIIQALSGAADMSRRQGGAPRYVPTVLADKTAGQMAAHAVLAALFQRERTGRGQYVEVPMFEAMTQFLLVEHMNAHHFAQADTAAVDEDFGYRRTMAQWRKPYPTRDGHVCFLPYSDRNWRDFFAIMGLGQHARDPRFATIGERSRNIEALYRLLEELLAGETTAHWLELGERLGIACAPVNRMGDLEADPHLAAVGFFGTLPSGADWTMRYARNPVRLADSHVAPAMPPRLGEHSEEILREIGLTPADLG